LPDDRHSRLAIHAVIFLTIGVDEVFQMDNRKNGFNLREFLQTSEKAPGTLYLTFFVPVCHENRASRLILFKEGYSMKFGKACCALRNPGPVSNIERSCANRGIDNEKAIGKLDKSRRSSGFTKKFGKNLAKR
jgi:hypothetical protein